MDYCILVTISRNCISFRYCRADGEGRFVDFPRDGECEMPFAIECAGNEFVIGQKALETATKGLSQNAFADIFDTCKGIKTFQFAGREEQLNKLPYFAIRYYISKILSDSFYGDKGTIDSNVSQLPLVFLFTPELDIDKRLFITNPFEKAGFQNLCSIGYHQLLLPVAMDSLAQDRQKVKAAIMVSVDSGDLLLQTTFDVMTCKAVDESIRIDGKGYDPRLKQATDLIWSIVSTGYYGLREREEDILKAAALDFLNGDAPSVNGTLTMSDGSKQDYFLSRGDLDVSAIGDVRSLVDYKLSNFLQSHDLQKQQCMVVLVGNAATDYFEKIFSPMAWAAVAKVQDKMKRAMLDKLYKMVADANYEVRNLFGKHAESPVGPQPPQPPTPPVIENPTPPAAPTATGPTIEEQKKFRMMRAEIRAKLRTRDVSGATALIAEAEVWIKQKGVANWITEFEGLKQELDQLRKQAVKTPTQKPPERREETPTLETPKVIDRVSMPLQLRKDLAEVKAFVRIGKGNEALKRLREIEAYLHKKGVTDFDDELKKVKSTIDVKEATTPTVKTKSISKPPQKEKVSAEQLMQNGEFTKAKREFALAGNTSMAVVCSRLIEAKRTIAKYAGNHNVKPDKKAVEKLEYCAHLYRQYGVATEEIEQLIKQYK